MTPIPRRVLSTIALASLLVAPAAAGQGLTPGDAPELESLQGEWKGTGPGGNAEVTIVGNTLRFQSREDFWYETTFTVPDDIQPRQLHATITSNSHPDPPDIGRVVVALFEVDGDSLRLGVVEDFDEPPTEPVEGDWEWAFDQYVLERVESGERVKSARAGDAEATDTAPECT